MGESDHAWGELAEQDDELAQIWDSYERLPESGQNDVLDAFVDTKHLDIGALVRIGARMAGSTVLAFAFPGGVKYRDMEDGRRWTSNGAEFTKLKVVRSGAEPSDTVIVAESETDGARLTMLADCDVAVLPAGAKRFTPAFADQLVGYQRVLVGLDNDEAGEYGAAKIAEHVPQAVRFAPPEGIKDWGEFIGKLPPFPAVRSRFDADRYVGRVLSVRELLDTPEEPIDWLCEGLVARDYLTTYASKGGEGKSLSALGMALAASNGDDFAGLPCRQSRWVYFDAENGPRLIVRRFRALGIRPEMSVQPIDSVGLRVALDMDYFEHVVEMTGAEGVVFDSLRVLSSGTKESDSDEMEPVMTAFKEFARRTHTGVLLIHHRGRSDESEFRGSSVILDQTDLLLTMSRAKGDPLASVRRRISTVKCRIDKEPPERWISINADESTGRISIDAAEPYEATKDRPRDAWRDAVLEALTDAPQSGRALHNVVGHNETAVQRLLKDLAAEGLAKNNGKGWIRSTTAVPQI